MKGIILSLFALLSLKKTMADQPACERAMDIGYEIMQFFGHDYFFRRLTNGENEKVIKELKEGLANFTVARNDIDNKEQRNELGCKVFAAKTFDDVFQLVSLPEEMSQYVSKELICSYYKTSVRNWGYVGLTDKNRRKTIFSYLRDLISWMDDSGFPSIPIRGWFEDNVAALQALRDSAPNEKIISDFKQMELLPLGVTKEYKYNEDYTESTMSEHSFETEDLVKYLTDSSNIYEYLATLFEADWFPVVSVSGINNMIGFFEFAKWEKNKLDKVEEFLNLVMDESNIVKLDTSACAELPYYMFSENYNNYEANYASVE